MNVYRFEWGKYSDSSETWFTHERKMTGIEVVDLLAETWRAKREEIRRRLREICEVEWVANVDATLLELAGFVPLEHVSVNTDGISDYGGPQIEKGDLDSSEWESFEQCVDRGLAEMLAYQQKGNG